MGNRILFIAFIGFILSILSCKKESDSWGEIKALKNNFNWDTSIEAYPNRFSNSKVDISANLLNADGTQEHLLFFKVPLKKGKYKLSFTINQPPDNALVGCKFFKEFEDELYDVYEIAPDDSTSYVEITEYDEKKAI